MPPKVLPDNLLEQLMRRGLTDREILDYLAEHENIVVTRQAISQWRRRRGQTKRPQAPRAIPWKLRPEDRTSEPVRVIRFHARRNAGLPLTPDEVNRLERGLEVLDGNVFHYDPDHPAGPWLIVPPRPGVDTGIVREPNPRKTRRAAS